MLMSLSVMVHHRHTVKMTVRVTDYPILSRVIKEPDLRVQVFCAAESIGIQDISFPHQSEIKVNGDDVKANLRGLKNKPGSTRPVDITNKLRLNLPAYSNSVELTYALTNKVNCHSHEVRRFRPPNPFLLFPQCSFSSASYENNTWCGC